MVTKKFTLDKSIGVGLDLKKQEYEIKRDELRRKQEEDKRQANSVKTTNTPQASVPSLVASENFKNEYTSPVNTALLNMPEMQNLNDRKANEYSDGTGTLDKIGNFAKRVDNGLWGVTQSVGARVRLAEEVFKQKAEVSKMLEPWNEKLSEYSTQIYRLREKHKSNKVALEADPEYQEALRAYNSYKRVIDTIQAQKSLDTSTDAFKQFENAQSFKTKATDGLSDTGKFFANAAMSVAEVGMAMPTMVINPAMPMALMGAGAGVDKMYEVAQSGGSASEALGRGLTSGVIEGVTEKLPIDNAMDIIKKLDVKNNAINTVKNIARQSAIEGAEEGVSYIANHGADKLFGDENAEFSWDELRDNVLTGAISGGVMGTGATALNSMANTSIQANEKKRVQAQEQLVQQQPVQQNSAIPKAITDEIAGESTQTNSWKDRVIKTEEKTLLLSKENPQKRYIIPKSTDIKATLDSEGRVNVKYRGLDTVNPKDYRDFLKAYADENLITHFDPTTKEMIDYKPITIKSSGSKVIITQTGVNDFAKKIRGRGEKTQSNLYSFLSLDKIIENSQYVETKDNLKGQKNSFDYYKGSIVLNGQEFGVKLNIKNTPAFDEYYYHSLENIEIGPANGTLQENPGRYLIVTDSPNTSIDTSIPQSTQNINNYSSGNENVTNTPISESIDNVTQNFNTEKNIEPINPSETSVSANPAIMNPETAINTIHMANESKERLNNIKTKANLSEADKTALDMLVRGKTIEDLPQILNVNSIDMNKIKEIYPLAMEVAQQERQVKEHKTAIKSAYKDLAEMSLVDSENWKDKKGPFAYSTEIMERNMEDVIKDKEKAKAFNATYFDPIHANEAKATRLKNSMRKRIETLKLDDKVMYEVTILGEEGTPPKIEKVSERGLVQLYGEEKINKNTLKKLDVNVERIETAVNEFRSIYEELIDLSNVALVNNGYNPIERRNNYFPHFTEEKPDTILQKIGDKLGINTNSKELPTDIAGLTHTFKPGKKWVGNFLERKGDTTVYDAVKGFDIYIENVSDVIFHTDDIQRLRALESAVRYKYSDDGIKGQIKEVESDTSIAEEDKQSRIEKLHENFQISKLPRLATELRVYTDVLAGKKHLSDRNLEHDLGRKFYDTVSSVERNIAINMVALNPGTWVTNFIPITQVAGVVKTESLLNAIKDTGKSNFKDDGLKNKSDFLTNRRGSEPLSKTKTQKVQSILSSPMGVIDNVSAEVVVRAKYYDNVAKGMSEEAALNDANQWAARIMADRSKGSMPTLFYRKNPLAKAFTMFQLEVNNQYRYFFKDVPKEMAEKGLLALAGSYFKMFILAFLYNGAKEELTGSRSAFDPINMGLDVVKDIKKDDVTTSETAWNLTMNVTKELPFVGGFLGGGRIPISAALPDLQRLHEASIDGFTGEVDGNYARQTLAKELIKPAAFILPPVGGGQIKKAYEGLTAVANGGDYFYTKSGEQRLAFPVENPSMGTYAKAAIFGKYAIPEARDYVDSGFKSLTTSQTQNYHKAVEANISYQQFMSVYNACKNVTADKNSNGNSIAVGSKAGQNGEGQSVSSKKKEIIDSFPNLTEKQREVLYELNGVSEKTYKEEEEAIIWNLPTTK